MLWLGAGLLLWQTAVPSGLELPHVAAREVLGPAQLERSERFQRGLRLFWIGATVAGLLVLAIAVWLTRSIRSRKLVAGVAFGGATLVSVWLVQLPFVLGAHWWRRRYGISRADYATILVDPWLQWLGGLAAACAAIAVVMLIARWLGDRWWLVGGPAFALLASAFLLAQPLFFAPRLEPLRDRALAAQIRELARREGVGEVDVEVRDASRRTRAINAEFYGIGPTKKIILWDTALDGRLTHAEIRQLAAHELGHDKAHHVWKSVGWVFLFSIPGAYVIARATRGRGGLGQPAAVPVALLTLTVLQLGLLPVTNAISRRYEAEADWLGVQATHDPNAQAGLIRGLAEAALAQPDPPGWVRLVLETHPTPVQRIAMSRAAALREGS